MRVELESYVQRHNLAELGETVKSLFESYEILESFEQLQESVTCFHVPGDATTHSGEDVRSSTAATKKLKPKSLSAYIQASSKKENVQGTSAIKIRTSVNRDPVKPKLVTESVGNNIKKKVQKQEESSEARVE